MLTCRLHGVESYTWLVDVLLRVSTHPARDVAQLTPRLWKEHIAVYPMKSEVSGPNPRRCRRQPDSHTPVRGCGTPGVKNVAIVRLRSSGAVDGTWQVECAFAMVVQTGHARSGDGNLTSVALDDADEGRDAKGFLQVGAAFLAACILGLSLPGSQAHATDCAACLEDLCQRQEAMSRRASSDVRLSIR